MYKHCNIQEDLYSKISPMSLGFESCASEHSFGPAVRAYWVLHYVVSGKGKYCVGDSVFNLKQGQCFLIRPGEITFYQSDKDEPWTYIWIHFNTELSSFDKLPYIIETPKLKNICERIHKEYSFSNDPPAFTISKVWEVISGLCENFTEDIVTSYTKRAIDIIKAQYMYGLSVQKIADQINLDRSYFTNIFKKDTGISPQRYLIQYRMQKALHLLKCEKYSVSVIANSVGYSDLFTFSRSFKNFFGVAPQKYKEIKNPDPFTVKLHEK